MCAPNFLYFIFSSKFNHSLPLVVLGLFTCWNSRNKLKSVLYCHGIWILCAFEPLFLFKSHHSLNIAFYLLRNKFRFICSKRVWLSSQGIGNDAQEDDAFAQFRKAKSQAVLQSMKSRATKIDEPPVWISHCLHLCNYLLWYMKAMRFHREITDLRYDGTGKD